jgi:hypothetical protein
MDQRKDVIIASNIFLIAADAAIFFWPRNALKFTKNTKPRIFTDRHG